MYYPEQIAKLIESYQKLPGIGQKTATRLAFHTIGMADQDVNDFAANLLAVKRELQYCKICGNLASGEICEICADSTRDKTQILVVEEVRDVTVFERVGEYHGLYHVLHGTISVFNNVTPDDINIKSLISRLMDQTVQEVILATNASSEGETTAMYLSRLIKPAGIKVTRLAHGLAVGSDIEYANEVTLIKAVENRQEI
ncbi:MAG: recombination mediator RecR [Streptococcaceae bacterium]|jgi:recombination protein RecR|nr:recombination mediator RecR [Streptococcaceae bacterium]